MIKFPILVVLLLVAVFIVGVYALVTKKPEKSKVDNCSPLTAGQIYSLERKVDGRNVDYVKVNNNDIDNKQIQVQFLFKRRLASEVDQPWLQYEELERYLYCDDMKLTVASDNFVKNMFDLKK